MKNVRYATGCFEIGDVFFDSDGNPHVITDVLLCHYIKSGAYKVLYEVDKGGTFVELQPQEAAVCPGKPQAKPPLQLVRTEERCHFSGSE